jgi:hypothetical protein
MNSNKLLLFPLRRQAGQALCLMMPLRVCRFMKRYCASKMTVGNQLCFGVFGEHFGVLLA